MTVAATFTTNVRCPSCPHPFKVTIPVDFASRGDTVEVMVNQPALRLAVAAHMKQHQS